MLFSGTTRAVLTGKKRLCTTPTPQLTTATYVHMIAEINARCPCFLRMLHHACISNDISGPRTCNPPKKWHEMTSHIRQTNGRRDGLCFYCVAPFVGTGASDGRLQVRMWPVVISYCPSPRDSRKGSRKEDVPDLQLVMIESSVNSSQHMGPGWTTLD